MSAGPGGIGTGWRADGHQCGRRDLRRQEFKQHGKGWNNDGTRTNMDEFGKLLWLEIVVQDRFRDQAVEHVVSILAQDAAWQFSPAK